MLRDCPRCAHRMDPGHIAMWNPIAGQKVRWQAEPPGYVRWRVPASARVVLKARSGGRDARVAFRCGQCATVVIPPDLTYDGNPPKPLAPSDRAVLVVTALGVTAASSSVVLTGVHPAFGVPAAAALGGLIGTLTTRWASPRR